MPQAVFLSTGISGFEYLDKIVQLPFCLPNLEERKKRAYLSKIVEEKELDPKRVLLRVQKELQSAEQHLYLPLTVRPGVRANEDAAEVQANDRLQALVGAVQCMREAKLLKEDPMRRAEIGISDEGLIEQIETNGNGARDDWKESFLFMLSEEAKVQSSARQAAASLGGSGKGGGGDGGEGGGDEGGGGDGGGDGGSNGGGGEGKELEQNPDQTLEAAAMLLAAEGEVGKNDGKMASISVLWNGVVQAKL